MARLIDADAMRDDWLENGENEYVYDTNAVLDSIDSQPTVDAVEVVRCRECKWYMPGDLFTDIMFCHRLKKEEWRINAEFHCYYGPPHKRPGD